MSTPDYEVAERRPIATRELAISHRAAAWLAARGVTANAISVAGMISGIFAGVALAGTRFFPALGWLCWLFGAVFIQLRLLANMLDGMVAVLLFIVEVEEAGAVVDAAVAVNRFGMEQQSVEKRRLADRPMPDERNVPDIADCELAHSGGSLTG